MSPIVSPIVVSYLLYLAISIGLTVWVARTLFQNGRAFLVHVFRGDNNLADSVNHLLVVGFYLINLGYVSLALKTGDDVTGARTVIELLAGKIGFVLLVLGVMHFFNLAVFNRLRTAPDKTSAPPAGPLPPPPAAAADDLSR